jgi:RNA polymerase sigma-70 factor (ECF subfamily)
VLPDSGLYRLLALPALPSPGEVVRASRADITALLVRVADGERGAFDPLFDAVWPPARALCGRLLPIAADADDAAQEAIVRVFTRAGEFDRARDALTWILAIAAWECRTVRRRAGRRAEVAFAGSPDQLSEDRPDQLVLRRELLAAATDALGALADADVATIIAALDGDPIARAGLAPATFRKRLERALARLRSAWRSRHGHS